MAPLTVLLRVEALELPPGVRAICNSYDPEFQIEGYEGALVDHHLRLLADAGFINGKPAGDGVEVRGLSWEGCEFLDAVRSPEVWRRTKEGVSKAGVFTFKVMAQLAAAYTKEVVQEHLGLRL